MISLISPRLAALPLYLSSDKGVQKVSQQLYLKVYKDYSPWKFKSGFIMVIMQVLMALKPKS